MLAPAHPRAADLVHLELELVHLLLVGLDADDGAIAVDDVLLELVRQNTLLGGAAKGRGGRTYKGTSINSRAGFKSGDKLG